jgi:hypothetical protein
MVSLGTTLSLSRLRLVLSFFDGALCLRPRGPVLGGLPLDIQPLSEKALMWLK